MKNKKILIILLIIIFIAVTAIIICTTNTKQNIAIEYLNTKYGDGDWKIISKTQYVYKNTEEVIFRKEFLTDGVIFTISSSYLDGNYFHLYVNKDNMVTTDCFLPTYYSLKYNLEYDLDTENFTELIEKMIYITDYHYPYEDYVYDSNGWYWEKPKCLISTFLMGSFYSPISVQISPTREKVLDIIPDNQSVPELEEIIQLIENYYSNGRLKNKNINDKELYELVFTKNITDEKINDYISTHIAPVDGMKIYYKYDKK
ncbi:MAG: hypothetical protein IKP28_04655 [Clostridia bacterium]|nr:hypothetical protein [Clostridia bacterium]